MTSKTDRSDLERMQEDLVKAFTKAIEQHGFHAAPAVVRWSESATIDDSEGRDD